MKIWIIVLMFSMSAAAVGLKLEYQFSYSPFVLSKNSYEDNSELNMGYFVTCRAESMEDCQKMCGKKTCLIANDSCDSCVSSSNLNIFAIFRDFSKLFSLTQASVDWGVVFAQLKSEQWRMLDENTILNLFDDTQSDERYNEVKNRFMSSCPALTTQAYLIVEARSLRPYIYLCQGSYGLMTYQTRWIADSVR